MADLLGAAAGCGMLLLIGMLVGAFLCEIGRMKGHTLSGLGRAGAITGLFALLTYGVLLLMRLFLYGGGIGRELSDIVQHRGFNRLFYAQSLLPVQYALMFSWALLIAANMLLYRAFSQRAGEKTAGKAVALACMLPGMECCFLPLFGSGIYLLLCAGVYFLRKRLPLDRLRISGGMMQGVVVVLGMVRCLILFRLMVGG